MEAKISEATKPDSGLRSAQEEISRRDQRIGWLTCLNYLLEFNWIDAKKAQVAHDEMDAELDRIKGGGR